MRQRVNIARVLASLPKVVLMDEPFGALDEQTRLLVSDEVLRLWRESGATFVLITHSLNEAALLSDRIVVMSSRPGRIKEIVRNTLPRPRSVEQFATEEFTAVTHHLWELLQQEGSRQRSVRMSSPEGSAGYTRRVLTVRAILIAAVLAAVEVLPRSGVVDPVTLVPLSEMVEQLATMLTSGVLTPHLAATGSMVLAAFLLASTSGMAMGFALWRSPRTYRVLDPYLTSYYAMPFFAFYPVLVAIFGLNRVPIILIAWAWAVVAVVVGTVGGLRKIPAVYHKVATVYQLSHWHAFRRVYMPAAAPLVFNGVKLALSYSIIGVIASEFILAPNGLGWLVSYNYENFAVAQMYAVILLIVVGTIALTSGIGVIQRRIQRLS